MRPISILNSYISRNLLFALLLTIFITTFVGMIGIIGKLFQIMSAGVTGNTIVLFVLYNIPKLMCYTLPMGLLVATMLTFNRMSADNELTALRASGIGLFQIIAPAVFLAVLISILAWWFQFHIAPRYTPRAQAMAREQDPVALLEADAAMAMVPGFYVLIGGKNGNEIYDVHIYEEDKVTHELRRNITAARGSITVDRATRKMKIRLENATIITMSKESLKKKDAKPDEKSSSNPSAPPRFTAQVWEQEMDYDRTSNRKPVVLKAKEMSLQELLAWVTITTANGGSWGYLKREDFIIELHNRAAWAIAPFTFILIAIPLGLTIARRETSAGLVWSVIVAAGYYIPMALFSETVPPKAHPEYFIWGLNLGLQALGIILLWRKR